MTTKRWAEQARRDLLAELEEVRLTGFACNVNGMVDGPSGKSPEYVARRSGARRLLRIAREAVLRAKP